MARLLFEMQAVRTRRGPLAAGTEFVVYTDSAGTVLADISATSGGSAIAGSTVTVADIPGLGPSALQFYGPSDNTDVLYLRCPADTSLGVQEIEADATSGGGGTHPNLATHDALGLATDAELGAVDAAAIKVGITNIDVSSYGDNLATAHAAIPAGGALLWLNKPSYNLATRLTFAAKTSLRGAGNSLTFPTTKILCTAVGAGLTFGGDAGPCEGFTVDGNGVANQPIILVNGAQRTFIAVDAINALLDNWTIEEIQNSAFISCGSNNAGRDGLVIDKEAGGLVFYRWESNGDDRYQLLIKQSRVSPGGYLEPTHIKFDHALFERGTTDIAAVRLERGDNLILADCVFQNDAAGTTAPLLELTGAVQASQP